jgi:hypothetical protein
VQHVIIDWLQLQLDPMLHHEEFPQYPPSGASSTQYENGKRGTKDSYEMDKDDNQQ